MTKYNSFISSIIKYIKSWVKIRKSEDKERIWLKCLCVFGEDSLRELDPKSLQEYDRDMIEEIFKLCGKVDKEFPK